MGNISRATGDQIRLPRHSSVSCSGSAQGVLSEAHLKLRIKAALLRRCSPSRNETRSGRTEKFVRLIGVVAHETFALLVPNDDYLKSPPLAFYSLLFIFAQ
jgi:hypothetical protein